MKKDNNGVGNGLRPFRTEEKKIFRTQKKVFVETYGWPICSKRSVESALPISFFGELK